MKPGSPPPVFLRAEWRHLVMANYEIDPLLLQGYVPAGTELDFFAGRTFVSVVGFRFLNTRIWSVKVPLHINFNQVNLRFCVRRKTPDGWRRGVVFIREMAPRFLVAFVARLLYGEHYDVMPVRHVVSPPAAGRTGVVCYEWYGAGRWNRLVAHFDGEPTRAVPESEAAFIADRYWGYTAQGDRSPLEYQVEHPPWSVWPARTLAFDCSIARLYGPAFVEALAKPPSSAFVADGSAVVVRRGRPIG